eukprot:6023621-Heterocapsa_arctica.AAC.1
MHTGICVLRRGARLAMEALNVLRYVVEEDLAPGQAANPGARWAVARVHPARTSHAASSAPDRRHVCFYRNHNHSAVLSFTLRRASQQCLTDPLQATYTHR